MKFKLTKGFVFNKKPRAKGAVITGDPDSAEIKELRAAKLIEPAVEKAESKTDDKKDDKKEK